MGRAAIDPVVRKQVVDGVCLGAQDDAGQDIGEIRLGIDAAQFAGLDERGKGRPVFGTEVVPGKECIFSLESQWPDRGSCG